MGAEVGGFDGLWNDNLEIKSEIVEICKISDFLNKRMFRMAMNKIDVIDYTA